MIQAEHRLLVCRVGSQVCGLPLEHVLETLRPLPVEPLAGAPAFVLGLSLIRGAPVPVIDLQALLSGVQGGRHARLVTLAVDARRTALSVGEVLGIRALSSASLSELPPILRDGHSEHVDAIGRLDNELLVVLNDARMLPEAVWQGLLKEGSA